VFTPNEKRCQELFSTINQIPLLLLYANAKRVQTGFHRRNTDTATEWQIANSNVNGNGLGNSLFAPITRSAQSGFLLEILG